MTEQWDEDTPGCTGGLPLGLRINRDFVPKRTPEMENHQVWVWLQGMNPPRWEIRGTGVLDDRYR